jgi:3-hydroxy-9,10-secoandrosta-1,3,5(10)-triene-9,17-dione monooxygenase
MFYLIANALSMPGEIKMKIGNDASINKIEDAAKFDVVSAAADLVAALRKRTRETDQLSKLPEETISDLEKARLFEMVVPKMYGGLQSPLETYLDALIEIGRGDGSVAWTLDLISTGTWMTAALFPRQVTDQVFAHGYRFRTPTAPSPRKATVRRATGGYVIEDGLWMYNTGFYHAHWDLLGIPLVNEAGDVIGSGLALLPSTDVTPLDDWDAIGLRGSGSTSVTVKDVFVPDERVAMMSQMLQDDYAGTHLRSEHLYRFPMLPLVATKLICPMLGMARTAVELLMEKVDTRGIAFTNYSKQADASVTHLQIGEATEKIDAAEAIVRNSMRLLDEMAASSQRMSTLQRARIWRDAAYASQLIWEGVDRIAGASGTTFVKRDEPLNRVWRDVRVATMHGGNVRETSMEIYGRVAMGMPSNTFLLPL